MINTIISAISEALFAEFGAEYEIYTESIEQGFHTPCFSIICINPTNDLFRGKRHFRSNQFAVHYFPTAERIHAQCNEVQERLFDALEVIAVAGDPFRGTEMQGQVEDGVLIFLLNYNWFMGEIKVEQEMGSYETKTAVRGD